MANTAQSKKRVRQNMKKRAQNTGMRSRLRTEVKKVRNMMVEGNVDQAATHMPKVQSILDNYARKGLISANKSSRLKSRMNAKLKILRASV